VLRTVIGRLPQLIIVALGSSFFAFAIINLLPGDIVHTILGEDYSPDAAAALTAQLHLDDPFFVRYLRWLGDALTGNLGTSLVTPHQEVASLIGQSLPPTIELVVLGQLFSIALGVSTAVISVAVRSRIVDRLISAIALVSSSMPGFVLALLLLELLAVKFQAVSPFGWAPPSSDGWGANLAHIWFPSLLVGLFIFPLKMRVFRSELFSQLDHEDYVVLARLKGISNRRVILNHAVRNASFGIVTVIGTSTAHLVGGVVVMEQVFSIPGMGTLIKNAVVQHDAPTAVACITIVAIFVVLANLAVDIVYSVLDPRVRDAATV
jgi:peptide/nickel transport system permease protein